MGGPGSVQFWPVNSKLVLDHSGTVLTRSSFILHSPPTDIWTFWCQTNNAEDQHTWQLVSASQSVQPGTSTTLWYHGYGLVYNVMCLFTPPAFTGYSFQPATEGRLRLSRSWCLVLHRDGLPVQSKGKGKCIYIALIFVLHSRCSGMDPTVLPAITPMPAFTS